MNNYLKFLLFAFIGISLFSCQSLQDPSLERIENVDINTLSKERIDLKADMIIHNPNSVALDLASADLKVLVDNIEVASIKQSIDAKMPANKEFTMPVNISMDLARLYKENPVAAIGKGLQIMSDRKLEVMFKGNIKAGKGVAKLTVPIEQMEIVKF